MLIYNSTREKPEFYIQWRVGETVNSHAFHACIHGFESRTRHHLIRLAGYLWPFFSQCGSALIWVSGHVWDTAWTCEVTIHSRK